MSRDAREPARNGDVKPLPCPHCGEAAGIPILWGFPAPETVEKVEAGEWDVKLGGCVIPDPYVNVACRACGHRWMHEEAPQPKP